MKKGEGQMVGEVRWGKRGRVGQQQREEEQENVYRKRIILSSVCATLSHLGSGVQSASYSLLIKGGRKGRTG